MGGGVARAGVWWSCVFLLAACNASTLAPPIVGFKQATDAAKSSLDKQLDTVDDAILKTALDAAAARGDFVLASPDQDCKKGSTRCRLYLIPASGANNVEAQGWPFSRGSIGTNVRDLMAGVAVYATNLEKIATANTTAEIKAATDETKSAVISLAGTVEALQKELSMRPTGLQAKVSAFAGPITEIVGIGLRYYTERVKVQAIREAVEIMEPVFEDMVAIFERASTAENEIRLAGLRKAYVEAQLDYFNQPDDQPINAAKLTAFRQAADNYDRALAGQPKNMFAALRNGHKALAEALEGGNLQFDQLWAQLQIVFKEAETFAKLIKQLADASKI